MVLIFIPVGSCLVVIERPEICSVFCFCLTEGDVVSGTSSSGSHHAGVLEGWFGEHWWNARAFVLLVTTLFVFSPLACFKRIGNLSLTWSERVNI